MRAAPSQSDPAFYMRGVEYFWPQRGYFQVDILLRIKRTF